MALKKTMNKREVARFHKLLKMEGATKTSVAKAMQIDPKTLAKFTPEAIAAKRKAKEAPVAKEDKK